ncbi:hypothetical protein [Halopiger aswanensis]|uniref:Uncharacterized protein n=1 Tax=Halopiger aswanensis TaxID=148449 RepID=A0A3R7KKT0_9EURY|nr:hypothetical protein [Halopiger aswanensis]RKD95033.1 hypothetical protein ATJ93_1882 [Halopiger aswanensis]
MDDNGDARIDRPELLCDAIVGLVDDLESDGTLSEERASELRSDIYRSIDVPEE